MHGGLSLGGPVWLFATTVVLVALVLAVFVLLDSLRSTRRAAAASRVREPLWVYTAGEALFLGALVIAQLLPGVSLVSALPVIAMPFALALGVAYLLRVVFPRAAGDEQAPVGDEEASRR